MKMSVDTGDVGSASYSGSAGGCCSAVGMGWSHEIASIEHKAAKDNVHFFVAFMASSLDQLRTNWRLWGLVVVRASYGASVRRRGHEGHRADRGFLMLLHKSQVHEIVVRF
jgi:hypothetical protein